jgi:hypothetical protein
MQHTLRLALLSFFLVASSATPVLAGQYKNFRVAVYCAVEECADRRSVTRAGPCVRTEGEEPLFPRPTPGPDQDQLQDRRLSAFLHGVLAPRVEQIAPRRMAADPCGCWGTAYATSLGGNPALAIVSTIPDDGRTARSVPFRHASRSPSPLPGRSMRDQKSFRSFLASRLTGSNPPPLLGYERILLVAWFDPDLERLGILHSDTGLGSNHAGPANHACRGKFEVSWGHLRGAELAATLIEDPVRRGNHEQQLCIIAVTDLLGHVLQASGPVADFA